MKTSPEKLNFVSPVEYKISVLGYLDENMAERLGGLAIESQEADPGSNKSKITLTGILPDQAALFGVLNALYNMRLLLLSVEYLGEY
jgi:hypothetical protein